MSLGCVNGSCEILLGLLLPLLHYLHVYWTKRYINRTTWQKNEEAIECYTQSLEINQFQAHANFRRALAYFELQEYEKSMNDLNIAVKLGLKPEECASLQEKLVKKFDMNM